MAPETLADLPYAASLSPHRGPLAADTDYDGVHFDGLDLAAPRGAGSRFMECAFTKVTVQDGRFRLARFNDVWLSDVRLTATELTETAWTDAIWSGCVAAGVTMDAAELRRVTLRNCKLDGVNLRAATLIDVSFVDCLLRDVDFGGGHAAPLHVPRHAAPRGRLQQRHAGAGGPARRRARPDHHPGGAARRHHHPRPAGRAGPGAGRARGHRGR